jgi:hypothetical protein
MLRAQPIELIKRDVDHYVVRCRTFDGREVQFDFTAELNETDIGDRRRITHQDAFFFVVHDDEGGWSLLKAVVYFDKICATANDTICAMLGLTCSDFRPAVLRARDDSTESSSYEVVFVSNGDSIVRKFVVAGRGAKKSVSYEGRTWTACLNNVWWKLDDQECKERSLILSLIYFDWARNFEYTDVQLRARTEEILWDTLFLQSQKNDERVHRTDAQNSLQ